VLVDRNGDKIGKLQDVYVMSRPMSAVRHGQGRLDRPSLTFVPLGGLQIGPDDLQVTVTKDQVRSAPDIEMHGEELTQADESALYHHFEMNYTPIDTKADAASLAAEVCQLLHFNLARNGGDADTEQAPGATWAGGARAAPASGVVAATIVLARSFREGVFGGTAGDARRTASVEGLDGRG